MQNARLDEAQAGIKIAGRKPEQGDLVEAKEERSGI